MIDADELKLWKALDAARGNVDRYNDIRNQLIELHYVCVVAIARKLASRLRTSRVDVAELESAGFDGLIAAIDRFDPKLNIKFRTYAALRVRSNP
ncbi:MAG: sigma factor [Pirellulales bacterium]